MAKSNLKTLNNNNVTQFTQSSVFSTNSYIYNTYLYLSFMIFFRFFYLSKFYKYENFKYYSNISGNYLKLDSSYYSFFLNNINIKKFYKLTFNFTVRIFFFNGSITHIYDFFMFKRSTREFLNIIKISNIAYFKYFTSSTYLKSVLFK